MHILITRPLTDAADWRARLEVLGAQITIDSLLTIDWQPPQTLDLAHVQALIVTSRNALRSLAQSPALSAALQKPIYTVGPTTGADARALGFADVRIGPASARDLAPVIAATARPARGHLLHLSGDKLAFDLAAALAPSGFAVDRLEVYRSTPSLALQPQTIEEITTGAINTVALLSPLTARTYLILAEKAKLTQYCQKLTYFCLSQNVADQLAQLGQAQIHVAVQPNSEEMLVLIEQMAAKSP